MNKDRIKSPSDTTIYAPGLTKRNVETFKAQMSVDMSPANKHDMLVLDDMVNKISNFVESIRMDQHEEEASLGPNRASEVVVPGQDQARECTERAIIEAEKYKAAIETPPGMSNFHTPVEIGGVNSTNGLSDDDFFHLICHIDANLEQKIERGDFVDLDKLLVKDNNGPWMTEQAHDYERLEWVRNEAGTFLMPAKKQNKINNFRRWEQAFCIYATIYCGKNPHRTREIWQYISVINTASNSFIWENVYNYDIVFRQLIQFNPNRSWAITYSHMWNLSMRTPLPKPQYIGNNQNQAQGQGKPQILGSIKKKPDYCWSYNKGIKCKFGKNCRFIERCSYCDSGSHGVVNCPRLDNKKENRNSGEHKKPPRREKADK